MTALEVYANKLIEALQDDTPKRALLRFNINLTAALGLAEANDVLSESIKLYNNIKIYNKPLHIAHSSDAIKHTLSYLAIKSMKDTVTIDNVKTIAENVCSKLQVLSATENSVIEQQCMRDIIEYMSEVNNASGT